MKKMMVCFLAGAMLMVSTVAMALPLGNGPSLIESGVSGVLPSGQTSLQAIMDSFFGANQISVANDQTGVAGWTEGESDVSSYLVSLGFAAGTSTPYAGFLGIYDLQDSSKSVRIMDTSSETHANFDFYNGSLTVGNTDEGSGWSESFGFYFESDYSTTPTRRYTEDDLNADGHNYAATYLLSDGIGWDTGSAGGTLQGNNDWLIAFDNNSWADGVARDFNDAVFIIEDLNPVPEPATLLLLGSGLVGLAFLKRRKS